MDEDTTCSNNSYPVIKEDFQNQESKLRQLKFLKDLEEKFYNQEDVYSEEEFSDHEEIRKQEDQHEEQVIDLEDSEEQICEQEDSYDDCDEHDKESVDSELYNCVTLDQVFESMSDMPASPKAKNNPSVKVTDPSETHEQSACSNINGKFRKLRKRVVSLKKRFTRLFRR